ncbi:MAG: hypothetical protein KH828_01935 [Clostridiales bacterium]|nr:hypothetical protein [Clostridiales bacterium]
MRKYDQDKLIKIICNKCGKELPAEQEIVKEGVCTLEADWGYFSDKDGEHHEFDLCEECYDIWVNGFKIPVKVTERTEML